MAATAPDDYLAILAREGLAYSPDLVLVGFFIGNDFETRSRRAYEYSYAATFGYVLWRTWRASAPAVALAPSGGPAFVYDDDQPTFSRDAFLEIELDRSRIYRRRIVADRALDTARVGEHLREMRDISASRPARRASTGSETHTGTSLAIAWPPRPSRVFSPSRGSVLGLICGHLLS